jgi:hypothetical protein
MMVPPTPAPPLVARFPPEIPDAPAPAPGAVFVGEPPDDEQEAVAKKKRPQIHGAVSDFMLLLWLSPFLDPSPLHPAISSVP